MLAHNTPMAAHSGFEELRQLLPEDKARFQRDDADQQASAVLAIVFRALPEVPAWPEPIPADPSTCPNCGTPTSATRSPYCGTECREIAAFVRQTRANLADGTLLDPERQAALGQVLWHLLGGGYPRRQRLVSEKDRAKLFAKANNQCQTCGAAATTFDHITTACNRPINLRVACDACTTTKQFEDAEFTEEPNAKHLLRELSIRIASPRALRVCDDAETWDWRAFVKERMNRT